MSNFAAREQTRMLANTLAQNGDPKFQVSLLYVTSIFLFNQHVNNSIPENNIKPQLLTQ